MALTENLQNLQAENNVIQDQSYGEGNENDE